MDDLGLTQSLANESVGTSVTDPDSEEIDSASVPLLSESDDILTDVRNAIQDGFAGVIFAGPPGTSKSWSAHRVALTLTNGDSTRVRFVQFHPSFQYEDFVEGFVPNDEGQFTLTPKHLRLICQQAESSDGAHVLVIDEISRCDAARVFGEALTYIEVSKRGMSFRLSSGTEMRIPANLIILATMNPWDRGVDEMDLALERRFAHVAMSPRSDKLREILAQGSLSTGATDGVVRFFEAIQRLPNPLCHIGHAYFIQARDGASLGRLWRMQLRPHFEKACRISPADLPKIENMWAQMVESVRLTPEAEVEATPVSEPEAPTAVE